jgi:hypothetical protein
LFTFELFEESVMFLLFQWWSFNNSVFHDVVYM